MSRHLLQDNRLESLPASLFNLRSLSSLDLSNNKLQNLPVEMWSSPRLKELNLAFNLLSELPLATLSEQNDNQQQHLQQKTLELPSDGESDTTSVCSETGHEAPRHESVNSASSQGSKIVQRHELRHHSLWCTKLEIQDKCLPDPSQFQVRTIVENLSPNELQISV